MRLMYWGKDGGAESSVWGFWPVEIKSLFSVALLRFTGRSREVFHTHAFNSLSWVLRGRLVENVLSGPVTVYRPSLKPVLTPRTRMHKVDSAGTTWVLTFRGPWIDVWNEWLPTEKKFVTLTHGRKVIA